MPDNRLREGIAPTPHRKEKTTTMAQAPPDSSSTIRERLDAALHPTERRSAMDPRALAGGRWWEEAQLGPWPEHLRAGVIEPRKGYRFRPENLLLPAFMGRTPRGTVVDLGSGTGSLLLLAAWACQAERAVAVERQPEVHQRLQRTLDAHGFGAAVCGDLRRAQCLNAVREALGQPQADVVVMNPPFFPSGWGRPSALETTHLSTHAEHGGVRDFLAAARQLLAPGGSVFVVYDAGRAAEALASMGEHGFKLETMGWVPDQRPDKAGVPFRIWLEGRLDAGQGIIKCLLPG